MRVVAHQRLGESIWLPLAWMLGRLDIEGEQMPAALNGPMNKMNREQSLVFSR
jgi:hypothetical protein